MMRFKLLNADFIMIKKILLLSLVRGADKKIKGLYFDSMTLF